MEHRVWELPFRQVWPDQTSFHRRILLAVIAARRFEGNQCIEGLCGIPHGLRQRKKQVDPSNRPGARQMFAGIKPSERVWPVHPWAWGSLPRHKG